MAGEGGDTVHGNLYNMSGDFREAQLNIEPHMHVELPPPPPYTPPPQPIWDREKDELPPLTDPGGLPPSSLIPYSRNPLFTGRERELRELARDLLYEPSRNRVSSEKPGFYPVVISSGLGGVGKTQLVVEFAHRYGRFFQSVHWVSLADAGAAPAAVAECGRRMGLHPAFGGLPLPDQVALTEQAWAGPERRLLIFDNCEDPALLERWRPKSGGGRVLVTSRVGRWRVPGVVVQALDVLSEEEAVALLERHLSPAPLLPSSPALPAIAAELGYLALALHLAGSYLAYLLDALGGDPAARAADLLIRLRDPALLEHASLTGKGAGVSPTDHIQHVGRTFALSYERLGMDRDETGALAAALLACAACLAPGAPFPVWLLRATVELPEGEDGDRALAAALERLTGAGLLEGTGAGGYRLHRLVGRFVMEVQRKDVEGARGEGMMKGAQAAVEGMVHAILDSVWDSHDPRDLRPVTMHLRHVADTASLREDEASLNLVSDLGACLQISGDLDGARFYYEHALSITGRIHGFDHLETAASLNNLGNLLRELGELDRAQLYLERALAINERVLGTEHSDTAAILNNLGYLMKTRGDFVAAQAHLARALNMTEHVLGSDHSQTVVSLNNLGMLLQDMGNLLEARAYYERALDVSERIFGPSHPNVATTLNNLGDLLHEQGDLARARPYLERALAISEYILGNDHLDTAASLNNLGRLLQAQGDLIGARPYLERALDVVERILGPNHPSTAQALNNLGILLKDLGELGEARLYVERALAIDERALGTSHPDTAIDYNNLGLLLKAQGDFIGAQLYLERALVAYEHTFGPNHLKTGQSLNHLGNLLQAEGNLAAARLYYERALVVWERILGSYHPDTATILNNLGVFCADERNFQDAIAYIRRALTIRKKTLGPKHPDTIRTRRNLAAIKATMDKGQRKDSYRSGRERQMKKR